MSDAQAVEPADVLVVDDLATIRLMLAQHVRQLGHRPTQASNGREALQVLRERPHDLVLLDVMMPEMDGYAVLDEIKSDRALRAIPVVMISGVDEIQSVVRCIERGAEDYLPKPFNATLLRARISACLEKKRLWDRLQERYLQLRELEKLRDSLTHMVVHDLRTPLTSLITGLYTVEAVGELNDEQRELWEMSISGAETLLGMINDLLDISKMEDGSLRLAYSNPSVAGLLERAEQQVRQIAREKGLTLTVRAEPGLPLLTVDEDKIRRTLVNLLGNAVKFTHGGGMVELTAIREGDCIHFTVRDTGEGIPESAYDRIFEKFGQVETRQAGRRNSTGLGLTFCKMVVEAHGGRIWVESELGEGSIFHVVVPIRPPARGANGAER